MKNRILNRPFSILCTLLAIFLAPSHAGAQAPMEKLHVAYTVIAPTQSTSGPPKIWAISPRHGLDVDLVLARRRAARRRRPGRRRNTDRSHRRFRSDHQQPRRFRRRAGSPARPIDFRTCLFVTEQDQTGGRSERQEIRRQPHRQRRPRRAQSRCSTNSASKKTDVTYVQAGSIPARLAAMQSNALQATLLQAPETLKAKELGFRALLDFTKLDVEWQQNGVADDPRLHQKEARHGAPLHARLRRRQSTTT